jgi:hypothetical protein
VLSYNRVNTIAFHNHTCLQHPCGQEEDSPHISQIQQKLVPNVWSGFFNFLHTTFKIKSKQLQKVKGLRTTNIGSQI